MSVLKYLGLDKLGTLWRIVQEHGGVRASLGHLYRTDDLKTGTLIGEDKFGNKYYENNMYFYGRNRWVVYNAKHHLEYDGSMIPAEWFGWMHYKVDEPPTVKKPVHYDWMANHTDNKSGTEQAYMPYSTTRPKIESWSPGAKK